jgi:hypothetical protein
MANEKDQRDDWRYILLLHEGHIPIWLETKSRIRGLPEGIVRIKVADRHYFLDAGSLCYDSETQKTICFLEITERIIYADVTIGPEGLQADNESVRKPDTHAFIEDDRFELLERPF